MALDHPLTAVYEKYPAIQSSSPLASKEVENLTSNMAEKERRRRR
jgi:hypothetical protein